MNHYTDAYVYFMCLVHEMDEIKRRTGLDLEPTTSNWMRIKVVRSSDTGFLLSSLMEAATADPAVETPATPKDPKPEDKESAEDIKKRARKPPSEGPCKMCKQTKPLNRLLLCYPCWLKDKLHKDSGGQWLPGDPHPATCGCDGPGGCTTRSQGN